MKALTLTLAGNVTPAFQSTYKGVPAKLNTPAGVATSVQGIYNLFFAITGGYSTGVTLPTGAVYFNPLANSKNTQFLKVQNDLNNVGIIRVGDVNTSIANSNGYPLSKGGEWMFEGEGNNKQISLIDIWIGVTDNAQVVHFSFN